MPDYYRNPLVPEPDDFLDRDEMIDNDNQGSELSGHWFDGNLYDEDRDWGSSDTDEALEEDAMDRAMRMEREYDEQWEVWRKSWRGRLVLALRPIVDFMHPRRLRKCRHCGKRGDRWFHIDEDMCNDCWLPF
jgi:hypothetical protein